jgi:hypothetical protein
MPIREVCSPLNKMPKAKPSPDARSLQTVNPKRASPHVRQGPKAPASSTPVKLPTVK